MTEPGARPASALPPDAMLLTVMRVISLIAGLTIFIVWYLDESQGMTTAWESCGGIVMGGVYLTGAVLLWIRPAWLDAIVIACLGTTGVYFLGALHFAVLDGTGTGLYSLASNAQFMPLLYVAAFIALRRGAAMLSWALLAGTAALYARHFGQTGWHGLMPAQGDTVGHIWCIVLLTHPCYILALQYITTLKDRLLQAERRAHADKQRFLAMLSHEIRSPLQAMLGSIDLLALKAHTPPERRAVDRIRHAADQLDTHLRDVSEFTRLEDPAWRLKAEPIDMALLARETVDAWQPQASAKGLALSVDIPSGDEPLLRLVHTDPQRVRQILGNLLNNAVKYTPRGRIDVRVEIDPDGEHILLEVADTGVGIPPQAQAGIFEPYVRLDTRHAGDGQASPEGSGLGLAIVRRLVDRLHGQVRVESQPGQGSCLAVRLPLRHPSSGKRQ